jgi:hypothetical protein
LDDAGAVCRHATSAKADGAEGDAHEVENCRGGAGDDRGLLPGLGSGADARIPGAAGRGPGYVTLLGRAAVVSDPAEKAKRWKEDWAAFYKDKNRGDDYVLIRVTPFRLEIVSYGQGLLDDPASWRPLSIEFP